MRETLLILHRCPTCGATEQAPCRTRAGRRKANVHDTRPFSLTLPTNELEKPVNRIAAKAHVTVPLGQIVATPGALAAISDLAISLAIKRHRYGDWGNVCEEDRAANDDALREGGRLMSVYDHEGAAFWIITEWDRSVTTILLPEEY